MTYNMTFLDNTSGYLNLVQGINDNTNAWFLGAFLIFLFLILLVWFKRTSFQDAFLASSFIVTLLAGLAFGFQVLNAWQLIFPITMLVLAIVMKVWGES